MTLYIDERKVDVEWEDNDSVRDLVSICPLSISMHEYGGFEQTGPIGRSIRKDDTRMNVAPGDIVLYQGNQISVFYATSGWSYTRLGHMKLSLSEIESLLRKDSVQFKLEA